MLRNNIWRVNSESESLFWISASQRR